MWDEFSTEGDREAVIIDPADSGDFISERILELQLQPQAVILTHGHIDHLMGALEVSLNFSIPLFCHPADTFLLKRAVSTAQHWFKQTILAPPPARDLVENQLFRVGNEELRVITTPGHTPGSICLLHKRVTFVGDLVFKDGAVGRTDFKYANSLQLYDSIEKLKTITAKNYPQTTFLAGHGESFSYLPSLK